MADGKPITLATYCCPSQSVEYFYALKQYLESRTGYNFHLLYDSARLGPSVSRGDERFVDFAFVSTRYGLELRGKNKPAPYSVIPLGEVTKHPEEFTTVTGYYSVVIVRNDKSSENIRSLLDLRGFKLAYSDSQSLSGVTTLLSKLKQAGENASFFGGLHCCGSHLACVSALVDQELDVAVVDSTALDTFKQLHPRLVNKIKTLWVWGPHPPHPLIVRDDIQDEIRLRVLSALQQLSPGGAADAHLPQLKSYGVNGFAAPSNTLLLEAENMVAESSKLSIAIAYY